MPREKSSSLIIIPNQPANITRDKYLEILRGHQRARDKLGTRHRREREQSEAHMTELRHRQAHPLILTNVETESEIGETDYESADSVDSYFKFSTNGLVYEPNAALDSAMESNRKLVRAQVRECLAFEKKCMKYFK